MRLILFRSLWTNGFDLDAALADCGAGDFDGIEGPLPDEANMREKFLADLRASGVPFIAEIATGGGYVPRARLTIADHLAEFRRKAEESAEAAPLFLTVLGGSDAWPLSASVQFFREAMHIADDLGIDASFETHRSRSTFHPWITREILIELPELRLTCDFSHWCCVCERLVLDDEPELLREFTARARHIHARAGYEQGPQVPHPAAPEYRAALEAHERWWDAIWRAQFTAGAEVTTMTPEFGPDGYLQARPFGGAPFASLDEINRWMAARERARFAATAFPSENFVNAAV